MKKMRIIFILLALVCSFTVNAFGAEKNITCTLDESTRKVTLSGNSSLLVGTAVAITISYPRYDIAKSQSGSSENIALAIDEVYLDSNGNFTFECVIPEDARSGVYSVRASVYGEKFVRTTNLNFKNIAQMEKAYDEILAGGSVKSVLDQYAFDIDIPSAILYESYASYEQGYIANELSKITVTSIDTFVANFATMIERIELLHRMKTATRAEASGYLQSSYEMLCLNAEDIDILNNLDSSKKELTIAYFLENFPKCEIPSEIPALFLESLNYVNIEKPSGGGSGTGGGGGSNTYKSDVQKFPIDTLVVPYKAPYFDDIEAVKWAETAINTLYDKKIISGKTETSFFPQDTITREEFVKIIVLGFKLNGVAIVKFEDVSENDWYYNFVDIATGVGVVNGISKTEFGAGSPVTRQDLATMLYRTIENQGFDLNIINTEIEFSDANEIADYAKTAVEILSKSGVINGKSDNVFDPTGFATRAEAVQMIYKVLDILYLL